MSSSIWTRCAGDSELRALRLAPWRVVEAQHQVSTRKLVDSVEEQELLEEMIDRVKPPDLSPGRLHYLLFTPFRYPPLRHGSRFGARHERGIWYGAEGRATALAEVAYYRLLFLDGTDGALGPVITPLTAFTVRARSSRGVDLVAAPFAVHRRAIASPVSYAASQSLGAEMRSAGAELFRYPSARAVDGVCIGAFVPAVFGLAKPQKFETWHCTATKERVEFAQSDYLARERQVHERAEFLVDGRLPAPAL